MKRPGSDFSDDDMSSTGQQAKKAKAKVTCPNCDKNLTKSTGSVKCVSCSRWVHIKCSGLTEDELTATSPTQKVSTHQCHQCLPPKPLVEDICVDEPIPAVLKNDELLALLSEFRFTRDKLQASLNECLSEIRSLKAETRIIPLLRAEISRLNASLAQAHHPRSPPHASRRGSLPHSKSRNGSQTRFASKPDSIPSYVERRGK